MDSKKHLKYGKKFLETDKIFKLNTEKYIDIVKSHNTFLN